MNSGLQLGIGSLSDIAKTIWRRKLVFAACASALFLVFGIVILNLSPRYRAESLILLPQTPMGTLADGPQRILVATDPVTLRSEVDIINSSGIAKRVIDQLDLAHEPEFAPEPPGFAASVFRRATGWLKGVARNDSGAKPLWSEQAARDDSLLSAYKQRLSVFNDGRSLIVQIGFSVKTPELASRIVNAHTQAYLDAQVDRRVGGQRLAIEWLRSELEGRAKDLREADEAVQDYRAKNNLIAVQRATQQQESLVDQELRQVNDQMIGARNDATRERVRLTQIESILTDGTVSATSDVLNSPVLMKLRQREADASSTLVRLRSAYITGTVVSTAQSELDSIQETIRREIDRAREGIRANLREAEARVQMFTQRMQQTTQKKIELDQAEIGLKGRETYATAKRSIYEVVLGRYNTLISEQGFNSADAKIISPATVPTQAAFPKTSLFLGIAAMFSAASAAGAALAYERFRGGVSSLRAHLLASDVEVLGVLPIVGGRVQRFSANKALDIQVFWERIRGIRNRIFDMRTRDCQVILVTSAFPQEGKSVFSVALARALASTGVETILIDGDLRRPTIAARVGVRDVANCWSDVLSDRVELDEVIVQTGRDYLSLLPALPGRDDQADALATDKMDQLLRRLKRKYRMIVIDSPPLAAASDALSLGILADKTVLVARSGRVTNSAVSWAVQMLRDHHVPVGGLVLIGDDQDEVSLGSQLSQYYAQTDDVAQSASRRERMWPFAKRVA